MDTGGRLPEDLAAEQAYLAELRAAQEAKERERAAQRRALLAAQGLLEELPEAAKASVQNAARELAAKPAVPAAPPGRTQAPVVPAAALTSISPELLAQLPPEAREAIRQAQEAQLAAERAALISQPSAAAAGSGELALASSPNEGGAEAAQAGLEGGQQPEVDIEQVEAAVLSKVRSELTQSGSVLVKPRHNSMLERALAWIDNLLAGIGGRREPW